MIEVRSLTKRYGHTVAVDDLTFDVRPGVVTGFLGPNGAGKSTTMRMMLDLDQPTGGNVRICGRRYRTFDRPLHHVGALLESGGYHPARTARVHLLVAAHSNGIPARRVDEVLEQVGLTSVAHRRVRRFSLGMRQRLGIAAALLGDPPVVLFDEPVNGLDADGVRWVRGLVRTFAAEGRTVLVSSHLLTEMQQTADHLIVIGGGRLIADAAVSDVLAMTGARKVRVRAADPAALRRALARVATDIELLDDGALLIAGTDPEAIGHAAREADVALVELAELSISLEQAYLSLTGDAVQFEAESEGAG